MSRFLFISTSESLPWGGSEVLWSLVARELLVSGHHVAYSYQYFAEEPKPLGALREAGAVGYYREDPAETRLTRRLQRAVSRRKAFADYPAFNWPHWLFSLITIERPDLIVLNACDAYTIWPWAPVFEAIRKQGIPYAVICQLEDEALMLNQVKRKALTSLYAGVVEVSFGARFGADLLSRQLGIRLPGVEIFDNPRNCSGMLQAWPGTNGSPARFACVGRLVVSAKGQDVLLDALSSPVWRSRNWRLTFYGKGWEDEYLQQLAAMYGLTDRVCLAGFQAGIDAIWAQEHICLQPSPKEGTPMTVVEAMSAGRPCLVTDIGRMPDLIEEGKTGWICSRGVASVSAALERAWEQRGQWQMMGEAAHAKINREWNFDYPRQMAERFVGFAENDGR